MATKSQIRTRALYLLSNHSMISSSDLDALIPAEHEEILDAYSWSARKTESTITLTATYSTGTVSGSSGSTTLTGSSTVWTSGMASRWIRIGSDTFYFKISSVASATSLTLETALTDDVDSGTSYTIFQHVYSLPSDFERVLSLTSDVKMNEWQQQDIDRIDPYRSATASRPYIYSIRGLNSSNYYDVEVWPVPSSASILRLDYMKTSSLTNDTDSPPYRGDILVYRLAQAGASFLHARTGDAAWLNLADRYNQHYKESLEAAMEDDLAKSSSASYIRDAAITDITPGGDYYIDHDPGIFR